MSEVERQNLFSRFKKHEKREIQKEQSAVKLRTSEETTAENIDHLHSLQKQFALLDLDPFISRLQGDINAITEAMEPYEGRKNEIGVDVWRFNLAVPGKWFDDNTAIRAATGIAFQLFYKRPDLNHSEDIDDFGYYIASTVPYFDRRNPTFIAMLYSPTRQLVNTIEGGELADVAPTYTFIGVDYSEGLYRGKLLEAVGISEAAGKRDNARFKHERDEYTRFLGEARMAAREEFEGDKPWEETQFKWSQEIHEIENRSQITGIDEVFGIGIEKFKPRFKRKINIEITKGPGRGESEVFFPERAGVIRNQIDQKVWDFLREQPMYAPYLETPFSEENK
jgi:hypothetical protein